MRPGNGELLTSASSDNSAAVDLTLRLWDYHSRSRSLWAPGGRIEGWSLKSDRDALLDYGSRGCGCVLIAMLLTGSSRKEPDETAECAGKDG